MKSEHRNLVLGMTGTLMSNDHSELWNLIDLVETNYLGDWDEFKVQIAQPIKLARYVSFTPHKDLLDWPVMDLTLPLMQIQDSISRLDRNKSSKSESFKRQATPDFHTTQQRRRPQILSSEEE
jgi:hypothetical protein